MSVSIPNSVTGIGSSAFYDCSNLNAVHIEDLAAWCKIFFSSSSANPIYYAHNLYLNDKLVTNLVIPNGVTTIGGYAFSSCESLTSVSIPNSVTSIRWNAFSGCSGLTSVSIPNSVTNIGNDAFSGCTGLTSVSIPDSVTTIGRSAFSGCTGLTSVSIPNSVTSIGDGAFNNCKSLTSVTAPFWKQFVNCPITHFTISDGVTSIGERAFSGFSSLTSVTIPASVTSIAYGAFNDCSSLTSVTTPLWRSFSNCPVTQITVPEGTESIGDEAFYYCSDLTSVTIPASVTSIGENAFYGCSKLESVVVKDLAAWCKIAFSNAEANPLSLAHNLYLGSDSAPVKSLVIPAGTQSIGTHAFNGCTSIESVTIPKALIVVGDKAFYNCSNLKAVYISDLTAWSQINFAWAASNPTTYAHNLYLNNEPVTSLIIPDGLKSISRYSFSGCSNLTSVTIPDSVTSIGQGAFSNCYRLTRMVIPDSVTIIDSDVFYGCSGLSTVTLPESLTGMGGYVFSGCSGLRSITIPKGIPYINQGLFYGCSKLTEITIPDGVETIAPYAFYNCGALTMVVMPDSVTSIGDNAFSGCNALNEVYFAGTENQWNSISIGSNNGGLISATIYYESKPSKSYTVTYDANGGRNAPAEQTKHYGEVLTLRGKQPTRDGYSFLGWATQKDAKSPEYQPGDDYANEADLTLYAVWQITTYTITYNANGGSGAPSKQTKTPGETLTLRKNIPTREGFEFLGWATCAKATTAKYQPSDDYSDDADLTLYAVWKAKTFTVTFNANGGSAVAAQKVTAGKKAVKPVNPIKAGFWFGGWYTDKAFKTAFDFNTAITKNITLYARWVAPDLILPAAVATIGEEAFTGGAFSFVKLSDKTASIGSRAFADCPNLTYIYIPAATKKIAANAFAGVDGLTILGASGSYAETYATKHGYTFIAVF